MEIMPNNSNNTNRHCFEYSEQTNSTQFSQMMKADQTEDIDFLDNDYIWWNQAPQVQQVFKTEPQLVFIDNGGDSGSREDMSLWGKDEIEQVTIMSLDDIKRPTESNESNVDNKSKKTIDILQNDLHNKDYIDNDKCQENLVDKIYKCSECDLRFSTRNNLMMHLKVHTEETPFYCSSCDKYFKRKECLKSHMLLHDPDGKDYPCTKCDLQLPTAKLYRQHLKTHHNNSPLEEYDAGTTTMQPGSSDSEKNEFQCPQCSRILASPENLKHHLRIHTGERPFKCDFCEKSFRRKQQCNYHMLLVHDPESAQSCPKCDRVFPSSCYLIDHLKIHDSEKLFKCTSCDRSFRTKGNLKRHLLIHDPERELFPCPECDRKFKNRKNLTLHLKNHASLMPFKCGTCNKCFKTEDALEQHSLEHGYESNTFFGGDDSVEKQYSMESC